MKWLEKIARGYINKIEIGVSANDEKYENFKQRMCDIEKDGIKILTDYIEEFELSIDLKSRFEIGDRAIINKYSTKYYSETSWDAGTSLICREITNRPIFVKITDVYVSDSWAVNSIENFIDRLDWNVLEKSINNGTLLTTYKKYYRESFPKTKVHENLGFYINVKFKIEGKTSFNPKWDLNENAFHKVGTVEANDTEKLWHREILLKEDEEKIRERRKGWDRTRNELSLIKIKHS